MTPTVHDFVIKRIIPIVDRKYADMLPKYNAELVKFTLTGATNAVSNALRRIDELPCHALVVTEFNTNDRYLINEMIEQRVKQIPIPQSENLTSATPTKAGEKFTLSVTNTTQELMTVWTTDFKSKHEIDKSVLCYLRPAKQLFIEAEVTVVVPAVSPNGCVRLVIRPTPTVSEDQLPNHFTEAEVVKKLGELLHNPEVREKQPPPSSASTYTTWNHIFTTTGHSDPKKIMRAQCSAIIERLKDVLQATIKSETENHVIIIPGETHTIGQILIRELEHTSVGHYSYRIVQDVGLMLTIVTADDPMMILTSCVDSAVDKFTKLHGQW